MIYVEDDFSLTVPPGGALITLQSPDSATPSRPQLNSSTKPDCLATLDDAIWSEFIDQLSSTLKGWMAPFKVATPILIVAVVAAVILLLCGIFAKLEMVLVAIGCAALVGVGVAASFAGSSCSQSRNISIDKQLHDLCEGLNSAVGGAVAVQYHKASPVVKHGNKRQVRLYRYISFAPADPETQITQITQMTTVEALDVDAQQATIPGTNAESWGPTMWLNMVKWDTMWLNQMIQMW